jgi:very-short-patch-repair endonuclease
MSRVFDWKIGRNIERPDAKPKKASKLEEDLFQEMKLYGLPMPERQFRFHPTRRWAADFCFVDAKIIVEVSGGLYVTGRHNRGAQMEQEYEKINEAQKLGYRVFMFGPKACRAKKRTNESSQALKFLYEVLKP